MNKKRKKISEERKKMSKKRKKMDEERPCATATTSAAAIAYNGDLLTEILLLIPAKSVIRFKSVCKHWHSLISDAAFSNLHTRHHRKLQTSLLHTSSSQFFYFNPGIKKLVPLHINHAQAKIRQSCNGLLLLECGNRRKDYYIYNPTTEKSRNLLIKKEDFLELHLAFDPLKSLHYKAVCLRTTSYTIHHFFVELYDSETHTWKRDDKVYQTPTLPLRDGIYWKNCIYWKASDGGVLCFDIEKLTFRMPPLEIFRIRDEIGAIDMLDLVESGGLIRYIRNKDVINCLSLYEITEDGCDWLLKCIVDFDNVTAAFGAMPRDGIFLMGAIRGESEEEEPEEEESSLVFHVSGKIMVYRFKDWRFEELLDLTTQKLYREGRLQFRDAYQFIESLAPV